MHFDLHLYKLARLDRQWRIFRTINQDLDLGLVHSEGLERVRREKSLIPDR